MAGRRDTLFIAVNPPGQAAGMRACWRLAGWCAACVPTFVGAGGWVSAVARSPTTRYPGPAGPAFPCGTSVPAAPCVRLARALTPALGNATGGTSLFSASGRPVVVAASAVPACPASQPSASGTVQREMRPVRIPRRACGTAAKRSPQQQQQQPQKPGGCNPR